MNTALQHLKEFNEENGYEITPESILETLQERGKVLYTGERDERRWYTNQFTVVEIGGKTLGYTNMFAKHPDHSISDMDVDFDINSICEVKMVKEVREIITYEKV